MIYVIDNKYYFKRNRKFIRVNITLSNSGVNITANRNDYIEDNGNIKFTQQSINEIAKKLSKKQRVQEQEDIIK